MSKKPHQAPVRVPSGGSLESLLLRFRDHGDAAALTELFDTAAPGLRRLARRLTGARRHDLADDALQETFLALVEKPERFDEGRRLLPWLASVLVNRLRSLQERESRVFDESRLAERGVDSPEASALYSELAAHVESEVKKLPPTVREAVQGKVLRGGEIEDLSRELGISSGAFRVRLHRGMNKLRAALPKSLLGALGALGLRDRSYAAIRTRVLQAGGVTTSSSVVGVWAVLALVLISASSAVWWLSQPSKGAETRQLALDLPKVEPRDEVDRGGAVTLTSPRTQESRQEGNRSGDSDSARVRVSVVAAKDGSPQEGIPVRLSYGGAEELDDLLGSTSSEGLVEFAVEPFRRIWRLEIACRPTTPSIRRFISAELRPGGLREETLELAEGGSLAGRVLDTNGGPVAGALVRAWCNSSAQGSISRSVYADAAGNYRVEHLGEQFVLRASADGWASHTGLHGRIANEANHGGMDLIVAPEVTLRGRILDNEGESVEGAQARMDNDLGVIADWMKTDVPGILTFRDAEGEALSDAEGRFQITGLPNAERQLILDHPAYERLLAEVAPPFAPEMVFELQKALMVKGRVLDAEGKPAKGARLRGWPRRDGSQGIDRWIITDEEGRFVMNGFIRPQEGGYNTVPGLVVRHEGYALKSVDSLLLDEAPTIDLVIRLEEREQIITGRVLDESGSPLRGIDVWVVGSRMCETGTTWAGQPNTCEYAADLSKARTDELGEFRFDELYAGMFELRAFDPTDRKKWTSKKVPSGSQGVEVVLSAEALRKVVLFGSVQLATDGNPLAEFSICPMRESDDGMSFGHRFEFNERTGQYRIEGLESGRYELSAQAEGYAEMKTRELFLAEGEHRFDFSLREARELQVKLEIDGGPKESYSVTAKNRAGLELSIMKELGSWGAHGRFRNGEVLLRGLPAEPVILTIESSTQSKVVEVDLTHPREEPVIVSFEALPSFPVSYLVLEASKDLSVTELKDHIFKERTEEVMDWWRRNKDKVGAPMGNFSLEFSTELPTESSSAPSTGESVLVAKAEFVSNGDGSFETKRTSYLPTQTWSSSEGSSSSGDFSSPSTRLRVKVDSEYYGEDEFMVEVDEEPAGPGFNALILLRRP